ncbi:hypothetical protein [Aquimarina hainanensis]|uniref:hypothetical protein n=1 Tax=Aquimarina hainanensis TaxID=1578017 RepID=UPI0036095F2B
MIVYTLKGTTERHLLKIKNCFWTDASGLSRYSVLNTFVSYMQPGSIEYCFLVINY